MLISFLCFIFNTNFKFMKQEKNLTDSEEHYLIEYDEAIGAIDAAIEFKNELICGRRNDAFQLSNLEEVKIKIDYKSSNCRQK